jgi:DNA-binding NtrC family response regulator
MNIGDLVTLEELEREHIIQVLQKTPDLGTAARILGIDPATLYRKRKRLSLGRHGQPASHAEQTEEHAHTVESNSGG